MKTLINHTATQGSGRLQMRVSPERRELLERAASLTGRNLTDFVLDSAEQVAVRTIEERQVLRLTKEDTDFMVAMFLNPPDPSDRLRQAVKCHQELLG
ncbi:conserved hypothetical protein [Gammaproteobacteria bacterium]